MAGPSQKIWDLPTRLFHWGLAVAVAVSLISVRINEMEIHIISGGVVFGLLIFRICWGVWGSSTAQFHRFFPSPARVWAQLRGRAAGYTGHSPLGALSVIAMLGALTVQTATGLVADDEIYITGPLRSEVSSATAASAMKIHAFVGDLLLILIALHLVAILVYQLVWRHALTRAMITGQGPASGAAPRFRPAWLALATITASAAIAFAVFNG